jgi:uncharacterized membrane protein
MYDFVRIDLPQDDQSRQRAVALINAELRAEVAAGRRRTLMTLWALLSLPSLYLATRAGFPTARRTTIAVWGLTGLVTALCWLLEIRWRQQADRLADSLEKGGQIT